MTILLSVGGFKKHISPENQIMFAKQAGFDGIDYIAKPQDLIKTPKNIMSLSHTYHVPIKAVHIPLIFVLYVPSMLNGRLLNLLNYFPEASLFNIHLSGFFNPILRFGSNIKTFHHITQQRNIAVSYESNPNQYFFMNWYPKATYEPKAFAEFCIANNLPMNMDTSHIASWGYDIVDFYKTYHKHINVLHLSDMKGSSQHLPFGQGDLPLIRLFQEMKKKSFNGTVVFEIFNFPRKFSKKQIQEDITSSIFLFKKFVE